MEIRFPPYYEQVFKSDARFVGIKGGRGSGKSHSFAGHGVLRMASQAGFRWLCIREIQRSIQDSVKQLIEDKVDQYGLGPAFDLVATETRHLNGAKAVYRGMQNHTAASVKSFEGVDLAWVEEAQTLSQTSLDLLTPTIRKPGSKLYFSWNPLDENDPVDRFFADNAGDPEFLLLHVNFDQNPWFPEELRQDMERDRVNDPDKYRHVWCGDYRSLSEARIFRNFKTGIIEPPENVVWFYGADWGFANDPTAGTRCCILPQKGREVLYIDAEAYEVGVPMERLATLLSGLPGVRKWPLTADSARPETIDYVRRNGLPKTRGAKKGKGSVEDGITFLQGFDIVIHPRCVHTLKEFESYAYKVDARTGDILPVVEDKNNHVIDALRYAVEGLHRKGKMVAGTTKAQPVRDSYGFEEESNDWKVM